MIEDLQTEITASANVRRWSTDAAAQKVADTANRPNAEAQGRR